MVLTNPSTLVYENKGNLYEAERAYKEAIAKDTKYINAYNKLGYIYYIERKYDKAKMQFEIVLKIDSNNTYAKQMIETIEQQKNFLQK